MKQKYVKHKMKILAVIATLMLMMVYEMLK